MSAVCGENVLKRIAPGAARAIQEAIEETGGREVFFAGALDAAGRVASVRVCARGHEGAVPALFEGLDIRDVVIHNHPSGELAPSDADLELASIYSAHGHGVLIVDNEVQQVYVVVEPFRADTTEWLDPLKMDAFFAPSSPLAGALPQFEVRPQQSRMMECVARAFNGDGIAVVEAPTGVGKTLAYLLPAVLWAVRNKERVIVSTRTINLQEQIIFKDIPLLQRCLDERFNACLVKGRNNYICLRRLERMLSEATLFDDEEKQEQFKALAEWVDKTEDGSRSDLPFVPERELWEQVCSESDACAMGHCPHQKRCFVAKARRAIAKADLVVVNHHMLFSDLAIKRENEDFTAMAVLPVYRRVIFDEAHSIEDSATEYFGASVTWLGLQAALGRLQRIERGRERGIFPFIKAKLIKDCPQLSVADFEKVQELIDAQLLPALAVAREALKTAFAALRKLTAEQCGQIGRGIKWRLTQAVLDGARVRELHETCVMPAVEAVRTLVRHSQALLELLRAMKPTADQAESPVATEILQLRAYTNRLETMGNVLAEGTSEDLAENTVRWIEIDVKRKGFVRVARCPLDVGKALADWVYSNLRTIVMTSATLTVQKEFRYFFSRLGLDLAERARIETLALDSPFDFREQALLCILSDVPEPNDKAFLEETVKGVRNVLKVTGGHAFVLFTSFYALDFVATRLEAELKAAGITALRQGQATPTQLLNRFRRDSASVLFATDSFWEGVDVAGESLQCVILPRLPFRVPTEPILEARAEAIESAGGNAFMEYSVPQAVIKFRQGFGRLIRRRSDRGAIVVFDRRILTKHYGRVFLDSLPELRAVKGTQRGTVLALERFFGKAALREMENEK